MDFLAKKREFVFVNIQHKQIRIHMQKVQINDYDLWVEHRSKQYRRAIQVILPILNELDNGNLPSIAFVAADKIGKDNLGSYSNEQDAIFLNVDFFQENNQRLNSAFSENTLTEVLLHELAHKQHWDAVKRFHHAHRFRYNSLQESKHGNCIILCVRMNSSLN
jgi:hypothetical protein